MTKSAQSTERTAIVGDAALNGFLEIPPAAQGIVVIAHGSGSSRFSKRNNAVAAFLRDARLGTFLFDLLTSDEEKVDALTREHRFNIPLLSTRLQGVINWLAQLPEAAGHRIGLFGSSTGAAAALIAAAELPGQVAAVVSRGGRVDLAGGALDRVRSPTLLVVGGADFEVLQLNKAAQERLQSISELAVVDRATHLFEEPGALQEVATLTRNWFIEYLQRNPS
jgi:pimeloyl-ACP methyl ester carboxylesterase